MTNHLKEFADDVRETLARGKKHQTAGLGTFSTCTRKAAPGRAACRIAMFRADSSLREQLREAGDTTATGVPAQLVAALVDHGSVNLPGVGEISIDTEAEPVRVVFRGDDDFNALLSSDLD